MSSVVGGRKATATTSSMIPRSTSPTKSPPLSAPRIKAKVSSSATQTARLTTASASSSQVGSRGRAATDVSSPVSARPSPRAPSPFKPRMMNGGAPSPSSPPNAPSAPIKAKITVRRPSGDYSTKSTVGSSPPERPLLPTERRRSDSLRLQHVPSLSSIGLRTPVGRPALLASASPGDYSAPPSPVSSTAPSSAVRVKAKVTTSARKAALTAAPSPLASPSMPLAALKPLPGNDSLRVRAPSTMSRPGLPYDAPSPMMHSLSLPPQTSSNASPNVSPMSYSRHILPRTQPSPVMGSNPRRLPPTSVPFPGSSPAAPSAVGRASKASSAVGRTARVDPASVPLPPNSPPGSTISASSQSSVSSWTPVDGDANDDPTTIGVLAGSPPLLRMQGRRSITITQPRASPGPGSSSGAASLLMSMVDIATPPRPTKVDEYDDDDMPDQSGSELGSALGHPNDERSKAKSNRKIADLEITNRSLLSINSTLEAAKHKQAKEIRDLRRRLRESRLAMPPRMFKLMKEQDPAEDVSIEDEGSEEGSEEGEDEGTLDEGYLRVQGLIEGLISHAKAALESTPASLSGKESGRGGAKVLSAEEVRSWREDSIDIGPSPRTEAGDLSIISEGPSALFGEDEDHADGNESDTSEHNEDDHKPLLLDLAPGTLRRESRPHSPTPPIVVFSPK